MRVLIFILFIAILSFNANAIAVVSDKLENDTLLIEDGASKLYGIRLQNPDPDEIKLQLTYDDSIAKVIDYEEIYTISPKESKPIFFNVSAPVNSKPDDTFTLSYTAHQLSGGGTGISLLLKINKNLNVKIVKNPDKFYIRDYYQYIPRAVIIIVIVLLLFKRDWLVKIFFKNMPKKRLR